MKCSVCGSVGDGMKPMRTDEMRKYGYALLQGNPVTEIVCDRCREEQEMTPVEKHARWNEGYILYPLLRQVNGRSHEKHRA